MSKPQTPGKDRTLLAQMASNIAGGIGTLRDVFTTGSTMDEDALARTSLSVAQKILARIDDQKDVTDDRA